MESKTPQFNTAIGKVLENLTPHQRICRQCQATFDILENDIEFFRRFQVPPPTMCPDCRRQNRLAFANYTTLFKRSCDVPNHDEKIISSIPEGTQFPVFDFDYYWHGERDWHALGRDFDLSASFATQFKNLFLASPQPALTRDPASTGSEYTSYGAQLKDCYYCFGGMNVENTMFTVWPVHTKNCLDMLIVLNTDFSYEGVFPENCYNCNFVYFSKDCLDCDFIYDCRNCSDCFGCVNLRNKKYCIWNEEFSKEEYKKRKAELDLGNREKLIEYKEKLEKLTKELPTRATRNEHSKNVFGNYLLHSKDCYNSMWALHSENLNFVDFVMKVRDSYDCTISATSERLYSTSTVGNDSSNVKFSVCGRNLQDCEYTMNCKNCSYCFGCVGLYNAKFCIFNKQYTEEEYWKLVDEIKVKMLASGEYGQFFPMSLSPFPYNASLADIVFPISKEKALRLDAWWYDEKSDVPEGSKLIPVSETESDIRNVSDEILQQGILSAGNGKPFRIIQKELDFYRQKNIPIPSFTPYERIMARFAFANNFKIAKDKCFKCGIEILSSYDSKMGYKPYCEQCYQSEVY